MTGDPLEGVRASAREWHKLQVAALGFVGLCGVLKGDSGQEQPVWLQSTTGVLALAGLGLAGLAVLVVATVAWPLAAAPESAEAASGRLRAGVYLTIVAVAVTALSTMGSWWPTDEESSSVRVTTQQGVLCGEVVGSGGGRIDLRLDGETIRVPLQQLVTLTPVDAC